VLIAFFTYGYEDRLAQPSDLCFHARYMALRLHYRAAYARFRREGRHFWDLRDLHHRHRFDTQNDIDDLIARARSAAPDASAKARQHAVTKPARLRKSKAQNDVAMGTLHVAIDDKIAASAIARGKLARFRQSKARNDVAMATLRVAINDKIAASAIARGMFLTLEYVFDGTKGRRPYRKAALQAARTKLAAGRNETTRWQTRSGGRDNDDMFLPSLYVACFYENISHRFKS
jgi:hypothetical protein